MNKIFLKTNNQSMVMLGIFIYLIFIGVCLFCFKKKSKNLFLKKKIRISNFVLTKHKFFTSQNNAFNLYQSLSRGLIVLDKKEKYEQLLKTFLSSGIDVLLPIYKYECYEKDLDVKALFNTLKLVKKLDKNRVEFNFFVFYNNDKFLKPLNKMIKYFCFEKVKTRIYNSAQIDYKLLSFINLLDLNPKNQILKENSHIKTQRGKLLNILKNSCDNICTKNLPTTQQQEGLFFYFNNQIFKENNYLYSNLTVNGKIEENNLKINITKTFNFSSQLDIYKIEIKNLANTMQSVCCCFGTLFKNKALKNTIYVVNKTKNKISIIDNLQDKFLCLLGDFQKHFCHKNYFYALKKLTINSKQNVEFYFAVSTNQNTNSQNIISQNIKNQNANSQNARSQEIYIQNINSQNINSQKATYQNTNNQSEDSQISSSQVLGGKNLKNKNLLGLSNDNFENLYNNTLQEYREVTKPKILSENKVLNYLLNDLLPNKIISEAIVSGKLTFDLDCFLNKKFDRNLIDKDVCNKNLKSYFLLSSNFFKTYFNLFYFYLGFWQSKSDIHINKDKTFVLSSANVSIFNQTLPFNINVKNNNLQNEIEVNNVKFTNLNTLSINSFIDKNLNLLF